MKKRDFLKTFGTAAIGAPFLSFDSNLNYNHVDYSDRKNLSEKEFWKKRCFRVSKKKLLQMVL